MYNYSIVQWMFFFYFYCFFGWCFESAYVSIKNRQLVNRGFMRGPFLPLYGTGAIMMLVVSMPFQNDIFLTYVAGCIGATALEYVTGVAMEALFKVRYWDYSNQRFNFRGHICLGSSLTWGVLTILMTEFVHKWVEKIVFMIPYNLLTVITYVATVAIAADFALSFKAAMDLRDVLIKMEKAREELERIQRRLDVIIALVNEDISVYKAGITDNINEKRESVGLRMEDLKLSIDDKLDRIKEITSVKPSEYWDSVRNEYQELLTKYLNNLEERSRLGSLKDFFQRELILSNPTMTSRKFREALEELKARAEHFRKDE
ncbi:MAG: hypothetical protein LUG83_01170 [Lachnospiraceae bacterium]|nr:hypothetical protein [Lachnospiraceae bacterium]